MSFDLNTFILGIVQGICEFLPVSSSGHLAVIQNLLHFGGDENLAFDLFLHCATVLVIVLYFRRDIIKIICGWFSGFIAREKKSGWFYGWMIIIVTLITGVIGLPLKNLAEKISASTMSVGAGLIFTAFILALVPLFSNKSGKKFSWLITAVIIGIAQGIAVLPGVSRSGMTIAAGIFMGMELAEAFKFSFLASIPAVLGAALLEFLKIIKAGGEIILPDGYLYAVIIAFVLGLLTLNFMRKLVISGRWAYFGLYCLMAGNFLNHGRNNFSFRKSKA